MRKSALRLLGVTIPALLMAIAARGQDAGDSAKGLRYAESNCASCHGVKTTDEFSPMRGLATFKVIANTPGMTATALIVWLQTPHKAMPNLILAPGDIDDVVAYITSLRDRRATSRIDVTAN